MAPAFKGLKCHSTHECVYRALLKTNLAPQMAILFQMQTSFHKAILRINDFQVASPSSDKCQSPPIAFIVLMSPSVLGFHVYIYKSIAVLFFFH